MVLISIEKIRQFEKVLEAYSKHERERRKMANEKAQNRQKNEI